MLYSFKHSFILLTLTWFVFNCTGGGGGVFLNKKIKHIVDVTSQQNNISCCDSTQAFLKYLQEQELLQELRLNTQVCVSCAYHQTPDLLQ